MGRGKARFSRALPKPIIPPAGAKTILQRSGIPRGDFLFFTPHNQVVPGKNRGVSSKGATMSKNHFALLACAATLTAAVLASPALTQQPQQPPFATTKVEGTEGVYIFRNGGGQSMFIVTPAGVIATDPIGYA